MGQEMTNCTDLVLGDQPKFEPHLLISGSEKVGRNQAEREGVIFTYGLACQILDNFWSVSIVKTNNLGYGLTSMPLLEFCKTQGATLSTMN